mgnify:FL=1
MNTWETSQGRLAKNSKAEDRYEQLKDYLKTLLDKLLTINDEEESHLLGSYGTGGETLWLRTFQLYISKEHPNYEPVELIEWKERKDKALQDQGRELGVEIEKKIKKSVLKTIKQLFEDDWELEINSIKRKCVERAEQEREKHYKEGLGNKKIDWTEMFTIMDYKSIIEKFWSRNTNENLVNFQTFEKQFAIDIGEGKSSKSKALKWISRFNSLRNNWAHEGTKEKGLSKEEVTFLTCIHDFFFTNI